MASRGTQHKKITAVSRIGQRRQVIIPKVVFDQLRLQEGDVLEVTAQAGGVSLKPRRPRKQLDAVANTLTAAEAKKLRLGLKQIKERKTRPWDEIKHELGL